jgi:hypothetical protein
LSATNRHHDSFLTTHLSSLSRKIVSLKTWQDLSLSATPWMLLKTVKDDAFERMESWFFKISFFYGLSTQLPRTNHAIDYQKLLLEQYLHPCDQDEVERVGVNRSWFDDFQIFNHIFLFSIYFLRVQQQFVISLHLLACTMAWFHARSYR